MQIDNHGSFIDNWPQVLCPQTPKIQNQMPEVRLPIYYLHQIAEQISDMGVDTREWLARSHLRENRLSDVSATLPFSTFRRLVLEALALTKEPALGLLVGSRLSLNTHGILGYAVMNSGTLREAIAVLERYSLLRTPLVVIRQVVTEGQFRVTVAEPCPLGDIRRAVLEAVVLAVKNVLDFVAGAAHPVTQVMFPFAQPAYASLAMELFKRPVAYNQPWAGLSFPVAAIDAPLSGTDPNTYQEALMICQRELEKITRVESLAVRVRRLLLEHSDAFPSLNLTARLFNKTPRTLHRHLLEEGTSFRAILEDVRHTLAVEHLKAGRLSVQEIAFALGYTDIANFRRAFKRWEGVAPSGFRVESRV